MTMVVVMIRRMNSLNGAIPDFAAVSGAACNRYSHMGAR